MPAKDAESETGGESDATAPETYARTESDTDAASASDCTSMPDEAAESDTAGESDAAIPDT